MSSLAGDIPDYAGGDRRSNGRRTTAAGVLAGGIRADGKRQEADNRVPYSRPHFLHLNGDEVVASGDKTSRPIILPRDVTKVPWCAGYAEVINAGKSDVNEDQARAERIILKNPTSKAAVKKHKPSKEAKFSKEAKSAKEAEPSKESRALKKTKASSSTPKETSPLKELDDSRECSPLKKTNSSKELDESKEASPLNEVSSSEGLDDFDHLKEEANKSKDLADLNDSKEANDSTELGDSKEVSPLNERTLSSTANLPNDASLSKATNLSQENVHSKEALSQDKSTPSKEPHCPSETESLTEETPPEEEDQKEEEKGKDISTSEQTDDDMGFVTVEQEQVTLTYFGIFDGHAGYGAAVLAASSLHYIITDSLLSILQQLQSAKQRSSEVATSDSVDLYSCCVCHCHRYQAMQKCTAPVLDGAGNGGPLLFGNRKVEITMEELVIGAIEKAFQDMDKAIDEARKRFNDSLGGCTALAAIFFMGKLFIANAGDCRAVICRDGKAEPVSFDFTPETERKRLLMLASLFPSLLHNEFTHREFSRRPTRKDVGKQLLCREPWMSGWALRTVTEEDLRVPVVAGDGKRARLLATIGVTRGFGDHSLRLYDSDIRIKPFLSAVPDHGKGLGKADGVPALNGNRESLEEVKVIDMNSSCYSENDVLIMASDGLWDVISCNQAALIVHNSLATVEISNPKRYTLAAQDLLMHARGNQLGQWRTIDDVTVFVIPLHCYGNNNSKV